MKNDWAKRLDQWITEAGWTVAEYVRRVNADKSEAEISKWSIHKYIDGAVAQPRGSIMERLARPFGKTGFELRYGKLIDNQTAGKRIPLLKANELGTIKHASSLGSAWEGPSVIAFGNEIGDDWFGVIVPDDACSPKFSRGDTVYCSSVTEPAPGDLVVAKVQGLTSAVCRRYRQTDAHDPQRFRLVALNPDYPDIEPAPGREVTIIGRIMKIVIDA